MWGHLEQSAGALKISQLDRTGVSQRTRTKRFVAQVGLTPKSAARVLRFEHAAVLLERGVPVAEVSALAGYYDQSHLTHDFRALCAHTPAEYAAAALPTPRKAMGLAPARSQQSDEFVMSPSCR